MHELAICQSLVSQLTGIVDQYPGRRVSVIHILVGPLSGVDAALLAQSFPFASVGTAAENAILDIQDGPILVFCPKCNEESKAQQNLLTCKKCGNWQTKLLSGDELILQQVELDPVPNDFETLH